MEEEIRIERRAGATRCPYCLEDVGEGEGERAVCAVCSAPLHGACLAELGSCAACGAEGGLPEGAASTPWVAPPAAARERCGLRHVKARRQGGVRRSGLCGGCHEVWLRACRDGTVQALRDEVRERRARRGRPRASRPWIRTPEQRQLLAVGLAVAAAGLCVVSSSPAAATLGLAAGVAALAQTARRRGRVAPDDFGRRAVAVVFQGAEAPGAGGEDQAPAPGRPLALRVTPRPEPPPSDGAAP